LQTDGDRPRSDAELGDPFTDDPGYEGRCERSTPTFSAAALVVVVGDTIERCSRHRGTLPVPIDGDLPADERVELSD
jgi:hypothetical protein